MVSSDLQSDLRAQLEGERQRLEHEIAGLSASGVGGDVFLDNETDAADQHPADDASELFEREKNLALIRNLEVSLQQVNDALTKMDNGTYGICEMCGQPIAEKRLRALPEATHCIECQAKIDRQQAAVHPR